MVAIAATQSVELTGVHLALGVNVAVTLLSVVLIWFGLRPRGESDDSPVASAPASKGTAEGQPV